MRTCLYRLFSLLPVIPVISLIVFSPSNLCSQPYFEQIALPKPWPYATYQMGPLADEGIYVTLLAETANTGYGSVEWTKFYYSQIPNLNSEPSFQLLPVSTVSSSDVDGGGWREELTYYVAPGSDKSIIFYSKQTSDNLMFTGPPPDACVLRVDEQTGMSDTLHTIDSAKAAFVFLDKGGTSTLIWQSVPRSEWSVPYFMFEGAVYGQMIDADGIVSPAVLIDSGYFPQVRVDTTGRLHIFYFSAPNSYSHFFTLKYAIGYTGSFATIAQLRDSLTPDANLFSPVADVSFSVSNDGKSIHVGWFDSHYGIYSLQYDHNRISIDSFKTSGSTSLSKILYQEADTGIFVFWASRDSLGVYHRYYSNNVNHKLFTEVKQLTDGTLPWNGQFFINPATNLPAFVYVTAGSGFHFITDIERGIESGFIPVPEAQQLTHLAIDNSNKVYAIYLDAAGVSHLIHFFSITTGIAFNGSSLPVSFMLAQNYPNPFNPATVINYELPVQSRIELRVYNILGQEVVTLANDIQDAGYHSITFKGNSLASGVYFYRIKAAGTTDQSKGFNDVKKMLLVK